LSLKKKKSIVKNVIDFSFPFGRKFDEGRFRYNLTEATNITGLPRAVGRTLTLNYSPMI
jgi:hypothetical protein